MWICIFAYGLCLVHEVASFIPDDPPPDKQLMSIMEPELKKIKPQDRNSFILLCIKKQDQCTEEQFSGKRAIFSWKPGVMHEAKARFWQTYTCVFTKKLDVCPVDGKWAKWSSWTRCKADCDSRSWQLRSRLCNNPRPAFGGDQCQGHGVENRTCVGTCTDTSNGLAEARDYIKRMHDIYPGLAEACLLKHCMDKHVEDIIKDPPKVTRYWSSIHCVKYDGACPVNGGWGTWESWSECSVQCGYGERYRKRPCNDPVPKNGGIFCQGDWFETKNCLAKDCKDDEAFTDWSNFGPCSESCGEYGMKTSARSCLNKDLCLKAGYSVTDQVIAVPCFGGDCPQAGGWSNWTPWTGCSAVCGAGRRTRVRMCDDPYPYNGIECLGPGLEEDSCTGELCGKTILNEDDLEGVEKDNKLAKVMSGIMNSDDDEDDDGDQEDVVRKRRSSGDIPDTSETSGISGDGVGIIEHARHLVKRFLNFGKKEEVEEKPPALDKDDPYNLIFNSDLEYMYTLWTEWSTCSATCGGGTRTRVRKCTDVNAACRGETQPVQFCNAEPCPVPGMWGAWQSWNPCSVTCGRGVRERYRACDKPLPKFGGSCPGPSKQSKPCNAPKRCPRNILRWSKWSEWSPCTKTCGGGQRTRTRYLRIFLIKKTRQETQACGEMPCPVDGMWAAWGGWMRCSKDCGLGRTFRDRTCTDPSPVYGGDPCKGRGSESMACYSGPCQDQDDYGLLFQGEAYLVYPRKKKGVGFVMVFIRFKPIKFTGTLFHFSCGCKDELHDCHVSVLATLKNRRVTVTARVRKDGEVITFSYPTMVGKRTWQDVFVLATERWVEIRLNDNERVEKRFKEDKSTWDSPTSLDLDGELAVGANRQMLDGFHGKIAAVRRNFKVLHLFQKANTTGKNMPTISHKVQKFILAPAARHPDFHGRFYSHIHFRDAKALYISASFQITDSNGLLFFNGGKNGTSFLRATLEKGTIRLCLHCGEKPVCHDGFTISTGKWFLLTVSAQGNEGEIRLNDGDAIQVNCPADQRYIPRRSLYVGGAGPRDWRVVRKVTPGAIFFSGMIDTLSVNGWPVTYKMATLVGSDGEINSLGYSVSDLVTELRVPNRTMASLRCGVPQKVRRAHIVRIVWFHNHKRLLSKPGTDIEDTESPSQAVSQVNLHPGHHPDGVYACVLSEDGVLSVRHVFVLLRYHKTTARMQESRAEWIGFFFMIGFLLLCFLPCLCFYLCKENPCSDRVRKMYKSISGDQDKDEEKDDLSKELVSEEPELVTTDNDSSPEKAKVEDPPPKPTSRQSLPRVRSTESDNFQRRRSSEARVVAPPEPETTAESADGSTVEHKPSRLYSQHEMDGVKLERVATKDNIVVEPKVSFGGRDTMPVDENDETLKVDCRNPKSFAELMSLQMPPQRTFGCEQGTAPPNMYGMTMTCPEPQPPRGMCGIQPVDLLCNPYYVQSSPFGYCVGHTAPPPLPQQCTDNNFLLAMNSSRNFTNNNCFTAPVGADALYRNTELCGVATEAEGFEEDYQDTFGIQHDPMKALNNIKRDTDKANVTFSSKDSETRRMGDLEWEMFTYHRQRASHKQNRTVEDTESQL